MTIVRDDSLGSERLSTQSTSNVNIKLRTPSLACLNVPLDTYVGFRGSSCSLRNDHQKILAGSVDLISEMSQQADDGTLTRFSISKPLISLVSPKKQTPIVSQEWRRVLNERFHASSTTIIPTSLTDSVARLRRTRQLASMRQSSLQTIDNLLERKHRFSFNYHGPLPRLTRRHLSFKTSTSSAINQLQPSPQSPFTSLPEIRSFSERLSIEHSKKSNEQIKRPFIAASSWEKSGSWSWKSTHVPPLRGPPNDRLTSNVKLQRQIDDQFYSDLPVIVESPVQQRSSLQTLIPAPTKSTHLSHSNLSFFPERMRHRLHNRRKLLPHSISNCDVSPNVFACHPDTRYPSTPVLTHTRPLDLDRIDPSPLALFDCNDVDTDSTIDNSSFRSCIDSLTEFSDDNRTDSTSSSDSYFPDPSSTFNPPGEVLYEPRRPKRLSSRQFCTLQ